MKRLVIIIAIMFIGPLASGVYAEMDESPGQMGSGGKYEMMSGGQDMMESGMMEGSEEVCPFKSMMGGGHMYGSNMMGGHGEGGHMHWMFIGFALVMIVLIVLFFWLLFRIARAVEKIAADRAKEAQGT